MMFEGDARYIVISEDSTQPGWESADQHYVVAQADARNHRNLLALSTRSDIQDYEHKRTALQDPIDSVVFHLEDHDGDILHFLRGPLLACAVLKAGSRQGEKSGASHFLPPPPLLPWRIEMRPTCRLCYKLAPLNEND